MELSRIRSALLGVGALTLIATTAPFGTAIASPNNEPTAATATAVRDSDGDGTLDAQTSALASAKASEEKAPVEDLSKRTTTTQTFANPDGTFTAQIAAAPVRVKGTDGTWADVDLDLTRRDDGTWAPKTSPTDVVVDGGAANEAVRVKFSDDQSLAITWPTALPAPRIKGGVATYVLSKSTDLVVATTLAGANAHIVLKSRPAADDPVFELGLRAENVSVAESAGGLKVTDETGDEIGKASHLVAWDADVNAAGDPKTLVPLEAQVAADSRKGDVSTATLSLSAPDAFLQDPETNYPVTIDPNISAMNRDADTWMRSGDGSQGSDYRLISGKIGGSNNTNPARAFLLWNMSAVAGKNILYSQLDMWQYSSYDCTNRTTNIWVNTTDWTAGTSWPNRPDMSSSGVWSSVFGNTAGASGCGQSWASANTTNMVRGWADGRLANYGVALVAGDEEKSSYERKFCSANPASGTSCTTVDRAPRLSVNYNTTPNAPAAPTGSSNGSTANISAQVSDADGGNVRAHFVVKRNGTTVYNGYSGFVSSGGQASVSVPNLNDGFYTVFAYANDGTAESGVSATGNVTVDTGTYNLADVKAATERSFAGTASSADGTLITNYGLAEFAPNATAQDVTVEYSDDDATQIVSQTEPSVAAGEGDPVCVKADGTACVELTPQASDAGPAVDPESITYTPGYTSASTQTLKSCDSGTRARRFTYKLRQGAYVPGSTVYRWKHVVQYCTKDGKVVKWRLITDKVYDLAPFTSEQELMDDSFKTALPRTTAQSFRRRKVTQCLPVAGWLGGCNDNFPQSQLNVNGNGGKKATRVKTG